MKTYEERSERAKHGLPVLVIVDAHRDARCGMEAALLRRYASDYRVVTADSPSAGLDVLATLAQEGVAVALVAADLQLPETDGITFLEQAGLLHRGAMRALLVTMDNHKGQIPFAALKSLQRATALGCADFWLVKGWHAPEELLYPHIQESLTRWTKANCPRYEVFRIVGERWCLRSHELRDQIARNSIPAGFYPLDSDEGQKLLQAYQVDVDRLPAIILHDGAVLHQPTPVDIAHALGAQTRPEPMVYDVAILGAGPAGLAAAVYAASEGLHTVVIEPQAIGGQAGTSSMIRNYLGFPHGVTGGDLAFRALEQALAFGAQFVFMQHATGLSVDGCERVVTLTDNYEVRARAVVIAAGVDYRRMGIPSLERLVGVGVFYGATGAEARAMVAEEVCVIGGANGAGQAALHLAKFATCVTLVVRGDSLESGMSEYLVTQVRATPNIQVRLRSRVVDGCGDGRLEALTLEDRGTGQREELKATAAFIMIGAEPRLGWLRDVMQCDDNGFIMTCRDVSLGGWPLSRSPLPFETSIPGVFAVGDLRHDSVKRVAGAVGEGSVSIGSVHQYLAGIGAGSTVGK